MPIRLFGFGSIEPAELTDRFVRDRVQPGLLGVPGLRYVYSGRGSDQFGEHRHVVTIWEEPESPEGAEALALTLSQPFSFEQADLVLEPTVEVLSLALELAFDLPEPVAILRLFRGRTRPDDLPAYIEDARTGTIADSAAEHGPLVLFLGADTPDGFVTVSLWSDWDRVARATGGNIRDPIATRHAHHLVEWTAAHYEIIPNTVAGPVSMSATAGDAG